MTIASQFFFQIESIKLWPRSRRVNGRESVLMGFINNDFRESAEKRARKKVLKDIIINGILYQRVALVRLEPVRYMES